jgi:hypothetical protein
LSQNRQFLRENIFKIGCFPGGAIPTEAKASGHSLQWTKALISKPAPHWEGTAVVNGELKELKLTDFKGKYLVFFFYPLAFTFVCPTEILGPILFNSISAEKFSDIYSL